MEPPRTLAQRRADALAMLRARHSDAWVGTASATGEPHLVPLSFSWDGERVILATAESTPTARHILASGRARLALGTTRDVVLVHAQLAESVAVHEASAVVADGYAAQADWDPRSAEGEYVYLLLEPRRILVWREVNEIPGRTVMRDGVWLS